MTLHVLYFAWVRERIGEASDTLETNAETPAALIEELKRLGPGHKAAFSDLTSLRVAIDQELKDFDAPLAGAREVAFFPPMTGG
ncbi:MAG: molybdopterin converting factor subunit 1 [Pseudomonadota bacterium]